MRLEKEPATSRVEPASTSEPARPAPAPRPEAAPRSKAIELVPRANDEFDAAFVFDVQQSLSAIDENAFTVLVHEDERVLPNNCRAWRDLRRRGYAPRKNPLAEQIDAGALVRCGALEFLARAATSRISYVAEPLRGAGPAMLPAIVASATAKPALRARNAAASQAQTLAQLVPDAATIESQLPGRLSISEPSSETTVILNTEAWGDVNADGVEDALLSVLNSAEEGGYFEMRLVEVTRTSARAPLSVLAVSP